MTLQLTEEQAAFILMKAKRRREDCAGVLTESYLQQFPVANTPENLQERRDELAMLDDLISKLEATK